MSDVRLYTYAMSPYAAKVHCFLLYKGLDFECFYINPLRVAKDLPVGRQIPVLTIDGESRADSTPIGLWLDERFPEPPVCSRRRATSASACSPSTSG